MKTAQNLSAFIEKHKSAIGVFIFILFVFFFLSHAWVDEDAYISFRVIDNFLHGYGLRWNPIERVQVYTHPVWLLLITLFQAPLQFLGADIFYTAIFVSFLAAAGLFFVLRYLLFGKDFLRFIFLALLLTSSKAFFDFLCSGLENPLTYLFIALFFSIFLRISDSKKDHAKYLIYLGLIFSGLFLTRPESILLIVPTIIYFLWHSYTKKQGSKRWQGSLMFLYGLTPFFIWELFSIIYYGFLFPNTYYAKVRTGISLTPLIREGLHYFQHSIRWDPATILLSLIALGFIARRRLEPLWQMLALGLLGSWLYIISIGGDYMTGRFLSAPFCFAAILLAVIAKKRDIIILTLVLVAYNSFWSYTPWRSLILKPEFTETDFPIVDERGGLYRFSSLFTHQGVRNNPFLDFGFKFRESDKKFTVVPVVGFFGYGVGPDKTLIDYYALADAFRARLPVRGSWQVGHYDREFPEGYLESVSSGNNQVKNSQLNELYTDISLITKAPLWSSERWRAIFQINLGRDSQLVGKWLDSKPPIYNPSLTRVE